MTFSGHKHLCGCCWYYGRVSIARARSILNYLQFVRFMLFIPICHWMFGCEIINLRTDDDLRWRPGRVCRHVPWGARCLQGISPRRLPGRYPITNTLFTIRSVVNHRITDARMYCGRVNKRACPIQPWRLCPSRHVLAIQDGAYFTTLFARTGLLQLYSALMEIGVFLYDIWYACGYVQQFA